MMEFLVFVGVAISLFLGILYLGKFHDIQAHTILAARDAAWERTVHDNANLSGIPDSTLASEVNKFQQYRR